LDDNEEERIMKIDYRIWMELILYIESGNLTKIARKMGYTYSHASNITGELVKKGWLKKRLDRRTNTYTLTTKGKRVREACRTLLLEMGAKVTDAGLPLSHVSKYQSEKNDTK
jgi:predicted transcriptional regulator